MTSNENHWVKSDGHLPDGAMIGGFEKEILYIIRAKVGPSMVPGLLVPSEGTGYVTHVRVHKINTFEVQHKQSNLFLNKNIFCLNPY